MRNAGISATNGIMPLVVSRREVSEEAIPLTTHRTNVRLRASDAKSREYGPTSRNDSYRVRHAYTTSTIATKYKTMAIGDSNQ